MRRVICVLAGCAALVPVAAWATGGAAASRCPLPSTIVAAWKARSAVTAGSRVGDPVKPLPALVPGHAVTVALHPRPDVAYVVSPGRKAGKTDNGGMMTLTVHAPGTYRFLLGSDVWIDVVRGSTKVKRAGSHDVHGCSGIRHVAAYPLEKHQYIIQIDASPQPRLAVMVVRPH